MENLVDGYGRPVLDRNERKLLQAVEGRSAMADYQRAQQHKRDNLAKLRTERLERELADNKPVEDNAREGAVKKRTQLKDKLLAKDAFTKRDQTDVEFEAVKKNKKLKGVRKEKKAA